MRSNKVQLHALGLPPRPQTVPAANGRQVFVPAVVQNRLRYIARPAEEVDGTSNPSGLASLKFGLEVPSYMYNEPRLPVVKANKPLKPVPGNNVVGVVR